MSPEWVVTRSTLCDNETNRSEAALISWTHSYCQGRVGRVVSLCSGQMLKQNVLGSGASLVTDSPTHRCPNHRDLHSDPSSSS